VVTSDQSSPIGAFVTGTWGTRGGVTAFSGRPPFDLVQQYCPPTTLGPGKPSSGAIGQCLAQHGYTLWTSFQPASRFWTFQAIESAWLVALAVALIGVTVWKVHRSPT
jgi:hypothetical protein